MRRTRNDGTKVWHNPEVDPPARRRQGSAASGESHADRREVKQHRAALEALFAPRKDPEAPPGPDGQKPAPSKPPGRIVLSAPPESDPKAAERQRLLGKLLFADGRTPISKAAAEFLRAGFTFPDEQDVQLQLLEHSDETQVRAAIEVLGRLLAGELPKRRAVLESRLRRIEQFADEPATRAAAEQLRRAVGARPTAPPGRS